MERFWFRFRPLFLQNSVITRPLVLLLLLYSFFSQFLPIEPYLVPYLTSFKHFTNYQVTIDIYPLSVYAQLIFTLLLAPACFYLSCKVVIILGAFGMLATYLITWCGQSLLAMQIMQITYGFGMATRVVFSSYIFLLVPEEEYLTMTSITTTTSLLSFMLASELSQLLALEEASYTIFFLFTLTSLGVCCATTFLLPKDAHSSSLLDPSLGTFCSQNEGWIGIFEETWNGKTLKILSVWWAVIYAGISLVQNYGTNLFDAIDPKSKFNGHVLAASQAAGSLGSFFAVYLEKFATKSNLFVYIFGSAIMGIVCVCMGFSRRIWAAHLLYIAISGIYQTLTCLVTARCGLLLSNRQFILLFSVNNFVGLLLETLLQAALEILGLSITVQYISFAVFFFLATAIFASFCFTHGEKSSTRSSDVLGSEPEPLISGTSLSGETEI